MSIKKWKPFGICGFCLAALEVTDSDFDTARHIATRILWARCPEAMSGIRLAGPWPKRPDAASGQPDVKSSRFPKRQEPAEPTKRS